MLGREKIQGIEFPRIGVSTNISTVCYPCRSQTDKSTVKLRTFSPGCAFSSRWLPRHLQPFPGSRSVGSGVNRRGQHRFTRTVRATMEASGKVQWTNGSLQVTRQQTDEGSLPAGISLEKMPAWEWDGRKRCFKCRIESDVNVVFQQGFQLDSVQLLSSASEHRDFWQLIQLHSLSSTHHYTLIQDRTTHFKDAQMVHQRW